MDAFKLQVGETYVWRYKGVCRLVRLDSIGGSYNPGGHYQYHFLSVTPYLFGEYLFSHRYSTTNNCLVDPTSEVLSLL